jgi:hypothetical protein
MQRWLQDDTRMPGRSNNGTVATNGDSSHIASSGGPNMVVVHQTQLNLPNSPHDIRYVGSWTGQLP